METKKKKNITILHTYTFVVIMMYHSVIIHVCVHILSYHNLRLKLIFIYLFIKYYLYSSCDKNNIYLLNSRF